MRPKSTNCTNDDIATTSENNGCESSANLTKADDIGGKSERAYYAFKRVCCRLIESQLGRMADNARSKYFEKKYATRAKRRYYAKRYARCSTLFFAPSTLFQLRAYWMELA